MLSHLLSKESYERHQRGAAFRCRQDAGAPRLESEAIGFILVPKALERHLKAGFKAWERRLPAGLIFSVILAATALSSCSPNVDQASQATQTTKPNATTTITKSDKQNESSLHSIDLPHDESDFPPGQGKSIFMSRCTVCHSLRYVTMQPDFPEAAWVKEVDKMRHTWGAHITDDEAKEIVAYLVMIKGKK